MSANTPRWLALFAMASLLGCTGESAPSQQGPPPAVEVGQRYRFVQGTAPDAEQALEVVEVTSAAVAYRVTTVIAGETVGQAGEPLELSFGLRPSSEPAGGPVEELEVAGRIYRCRVEEQGAFRLYLAVDENGQLRFPGVVKIVSKDEVAWELKAIE